jgi:hypothetical protein
MPCVPAPRDQHSQQFSGRTYGHAVRSVTFDSHALLTTGCRFLYTLFVMMDANFRLKNRTHKNDDQDPRLSPGWSYCVAATPFEEFLKTHIHQEDVRTVQAHRRWLVVTLLCRSQLVQAFRPSYSQIRSSCAAIEQQELLAWHAGMNCGVHLA